MISSGKNLLRVRNSVYYLIHISLIGAAASLLADQKFMTLGFELLLISLLVWLSREWTIHKKIKSIAIPFVEPSGTGRVNTLVNLELALTDCKNNQQDFVIALNKLANDEPVPNVGGIVGQSLKNLQLSLTRIRADEKRRLVVAQGLAELAEFRGNDGAVSAYAYQVISYVVKYVKANQGAFYCMDFDLQRLELLSTYAYGKTKYPVNEITIEPGQGMLGQCIIEKEIIYLNSVPKNYVRISSGLGEAAPTCVIITPLMYRGNIYGVIEIAAFNALEDFEMEFLKKASEVIGTELHSVKNFSHTKKLLEQSQELSRELKFREEDLHQSMEVMKQTQEMMKKKEADLLKHMEELDHMHGQMSLKEVELKKHLKNVEEERSKNVAILEGCVDGVISFNGKGIVSFINNAACEIFSIVASDILEQPVSNLLHLSIVEAQGSQDLMLCSDNGKSIEVRTEITINDKQENELAVLITATRVSVSDETIFTLFIQKISVDIF